MINKDLKIINYLSSILIISCLVFSYISILDAQEVPVDDTGEYLIYKKIEIILTKHLKKEGCWQCHQDMYPDLALNPNSPSQPILSCWPYPLYYSTLDFRPNKKFENFKPSENFTNNETYK